MIKLIDYPNFKFIFLRPVFYFKNKFFYRTWLFKKIKINFKNFNSLISIFSKHALIRSLYQNSTFLYTASFSLFFNNFINKYRILYTFNSWTFLNLFFKNTILIKNFFKLYVQIGNLFKNYIKLNNLFKHFRLSPFTLKNVFIFLS